jgi:phosphate starvation-inducible protein PhoH and related proteins
MYLMSLLLSSMIYSTVSFNKNLLKVRNLRQFSSKMNEIIPKTNQQIKYDEFLNNPQIKLIVGNGPAGTGKTLIACKNAIKQYQLNKVDKIVITRPIITVDEDIGFLPGDINDKMNPWTLPIFDVFREYFDSTEIKYMVTENKIEIVPLGFMRGRTFKNSFIIADEMQNSSPTQMLMLLTRIGENSKMAITGDLNQSDIKSVNGFHDLIVKLNKQYEDDYYKMIKDKMAIVNFKNGDIMRSDIVSKILEIYK